MTASRRVPGWVFWSLLLFVLAGGLWAGLAVRDWAWNQTEDIRFQGDLQNALKWGRMSVRRGIAAVYDREDDKRETWGHPGYGLDYAPIRLFIVHHWVKWLRATQGSDQWDNTYEFHAFMLRVNLACELTACVLAFFITRDWLEKDAQTRLKILECDLPPPALTGEDALPFWRRSRWRQWIWPLFTALLLWFNPAVILNAHAWPQWDTWVLPVFLGTIFCAGRGWWLAAGLILGAGSMGKGQALLVLPALALWPVFRGQFTSSLKLLLGVAGGMAAIGWVFMVRTPEAWNCIYWTLGLLALGVPLFAWGGWKSRRSALLALLTMSLTLLWAWCLWRNMPLSRGMLTMLFLLVLGLTALLWAGRSWATWAVGLLTLAGFGGALMHGGSLAWLKIGVGFPTYHHRRLANGVLSNLATTCGQMFDLQLQDSVFALPCPTWLSAEPWSISLRTLLIASYVVMLPLCAWIIARQDQAGRSKWLMAVTLPFLAMFLFLPQMHERYLLWIAALSCLWIPAAGLWTLIPHALLTGASFLFMGLTMCMASGHPPENYEQWSWLVPAQAWVLLAILLLGLPIAWRRPRPPRNLRNRESETVVAAH